MARRAVRSGVGCAAALALLCLPATASGDLRSLEASCARRDASTGATAKRVRLPFTFCDDGVPAAGGTTANPGAVRALAVPERYAGFAGLPPKAPPDQGSGADANGDIALDADLSIPDRPRPPGGFPLIVVMHTCCAGDKGNFEAANVDAPGEFWHYSNAWFASRGYVVLTYTSRGFVNAQGHGSTGQTQLDSRRYEVNDYQYLACLVAAARDLDPTQRGAQRIDPRRVVISGSSYGGGLSWLAVTDPRWNCAAAGHRNVRMRLAAAAPKYGWSDLLYSLVPNGSHLRDALPPPDPATASTKQPFGMPRTSLVAALYATGKSGQPPSEAHATFPPEVERATACFLSTSPYEQNPLCTATGVIPTIADRFLTDRSPYYQGRFFSGLRNRTVRPVPVFGAGSLTSPAFGQVEHVMMARLLRATFPAYPLQEYYGDIGDFTQSKAKEWGDLCGGDLHVCRLGDYPKGDLNARPRQLRRRGVATRLDRFLDHYAKPPGDPRAPRPRFDVTAALQVCPENASAAFPADQPGQRFTASRFGLLAPDRLRLSASGTRTTSYKATPNPHATNDDPIGNFVHNGGRCPVDTGPAGAGVAVYDIPPLSNGVVMIGRTRVRVPYTSTGSDLQLDARLYELLPSGGQVLVDRGVRRLTAASGTAILDLEGNGWRFAKGDRLRIELAQDDDPNVRASTIPSSLVLHGAALEIPVRRGSRR